MFWVKPVLWSRASVRSFSRAIESLARLRRLATSALVGRVVEPADRTDLTLLCARHTNYLHQRSASLVASTFWMNRRSRAESASFVSCRFPPDPLPTPCG